jgi:hypothetical protein
MLLSNSVPVESVAASSKYNVRPTQLEGSGVDMKYPLPLGKLTPVVMRENGIPISKV